MTKADPEEDMPASADWSTVRGIHVSRRPASQVLASFDIYRLLGTCRVDRDILQSWKHKGLHPDPNLCALGANRSDEAVSISWNPVDYYPCFSSSNKLFALTNWVRPPSKRDCMDIETIPVSVRGTGHTKMDPSNGYWYAPIFVLRG